MNGIDRGSLIPAHQTAGSQLKHVKAGKSLRQDAKRMPAKHVMPVEFKLNGARAVRCKDIARAHSNLKFKAFGVDHDETDHLIADSVFKISSSATTSIDCVWVFLASGTSDAVAAKKACEAVLSSR